MAEDAKAAGARLRAAPSVPSSRPAASVAFSDLPGVSVEGPPQRVHHTAQPSVEISRNAKGEPSWCIKGSGENLHAVADAVLALDERLRRELRPQGASGG